MELFGLQPNEFRDLLLSVGTHRGRRPLSPVEVASALEKMQAAGASPKDCAAAVHLDGTAMIGRFLRLLQLHPEIRHMVDWGQSGARIGFSSAAELARLGAEDQVRAARSVVENQLSSAEVKQIVQRARRSDRGIAGAIEDIVQLRPKIERRHIFIGAIGSQQLRELLSSITQERRDLILDDVIRELFRSAADLSGRLGPAKFTIASSEELPSYLLDKTTDIEAGVNAALLRRGVA